MTHQSHRTPGIATIGNQTGFWLRTRRFLWVLSAYVCLLVLLPGCAERRNSETIQIGISDFPAYELLYLAQERGFFRDEGVKVRIVEFSSQSDAASAFGNGRLDGIATTVVEMVIANATAPGSVRAVWVIDYSQGADVILAPARIRNIADLKERRVGLEVSSVSLLLLNRALQKEGLALNDVKLINMSPLAGEAALAEGKIDAIVSYTPHSERLLKLPGIRKIFDSNSIPGEILDILAFKADLIDARPDDIKRILRAYQRALFFLRDQPQQAIVIMAQREHIDAQSFRRLLGNDMHILSAEEQVSYFELGGTLEQKIALTVDVLQQSGLIQSMPNRRQLIYDSALPFSNSKH